MKHPVMEELSSKLTWFYKFVVPAFWFAVAIPWAWKLLVETRTVGETAGRIDRLLVLACLFVGSGVVFWMCVRAKRVWIDGEEFLVSNYRETIRVPFRDVGRVSVSILLTPELAWLHLRTATPFGPRIVFIPKLPWTGGFRRNPIVDRLTDMIGVGSLGGQRNESSMEG